MASQAKTKEPGAFSAFEWMIAWRYLRARRTEGFVSVTAILSFIGIMLGVATLIIVMAVMNGFRSELYSKILGMNGHIIVQSSGRPFHDFKQVQKQLQQVDGIDKVMPLIEGQVMVSTPSQTGGAVLRGMTGLDLKNLSAIAKKVVHGSLVKFDQSGGVAIGSRMANNMGVHIGDQISFIAPRGTQTPFGTAPRIKAFPITAIFEIGMTEYDANFAFISLKDAQNFFNLQGRTSVLEVMISDVEQTKPMHLKIKKMLGNNYSLSDWSQRNKSFFDTLQLERNMMFIILTLIILVAALNIISGMIMLVKDKSRDIAVLRTMGATKGSILRIFFITGASIGIVGTIAGFLLGLFVCLNFTEIREYVGHLLGQDPISSGVYFITNMPAEMNVKETITVVLMGIILSMLATIYPSWRASRLDPVEVLRYE